MTTPVRKLLNTLVLVVVCWGIPASARAQSEDWETLVAPYVLFGSLTGDAAVGPTGPVPVDLGFSDLVKNLELGVMVHAEAWKGAWGVMADFMFMRRRIVRAGVENSIGRRVVLVARNVRSGPELAPVQRP